ncbi:MAG: sulfite exporter TauE/SafE family protein [Pseudolabrys sp.]
MPTDPIFWITVVIAVTLVGLAKGGFSGIGSVATPLLALVLPPLQAAAIILPILLLQDAISVWVYRKDWDAWNVKVLVAGAVIGVGLAWSIAAFVSNDAIRLTVAVIGLVFCANAFLNRGPVAPRRPSSASGVFWGAASGFTSALAQAGSPPFQMHVLPQRMPKMTLVGTQALFFAATNVMKVAPYFALGQFSTEGLSVSLALVPLAVATNFLGIWLVRKTPQETFYKIAYTLMFLVSVGLLYQGATGLLFK